MPTSREVTRSTADTSGEPFEATNWIDADTAGPPAHVLPAADESYTVLGEHCIGGGSGGVRPVRVRGL
jgi:hypothetical protein